MNSPGIATGGGGSPADVSTTKPRTKMKTKRMKPSMKHLKDETSKSSIVWVSTKANKLVESVVANNASDKLLSAENSRLSLLS